MASRSTLQTLESCIDCGPVACRVRRVRTTMRPMQMTIRRAGCAGSPIPKPPPMLTDARVDTYIVPHDTSRRAPDTTSRSQDTSPSAQDTQTIDTIPDGLEAPDASISKSPYFPGSPINAVLIMYSCFSTTAPCAPPTATDAKAIRSALYGTPMGSIAAPQLLKAQLQLESKPSKNSKAISLCYQHDSLCGQLTPSPPLPGALVDTLHRTLFVKGLGFAQWRLDQGKTPLAQILPDVASATLFAKKGGIGLEITRSKPQPCTYRFAEHWCHAR